MTEVVIVLWKYPDNSAFGTVGAYASDELANEAKNLVERCCDGTRDFWIEHLPVIGAP